MVTRSQTPIPESSRKLDDFMNEAQIAFRQQSLPQTSAVLKSPEMGLKPEQARQVNALEKKLQDAFVNHTQMRTEGGKPALYFDENTARTLFMNVLGSTDLTTEQKKFLYEKKTEYWLTLLQNGFGDEAVKKIKTKDEEGAREAISLGHQAGEQLARAGIGKVDEHDANLLRYMGKNLNETQKQDMFRAASGIMSAATLLSVGLELGIGAIGSPTSGIQRQLWEQMQQKITEGIQRLKEAQSDLDRKRLKQELEHDLDKELERRQIGDPDKRKEILASALDGDDVQTMNLMALATMRTHYPKKEILVPMIGKLAADANAKRRFMQEKLLNTEADARLVDINAIEKEKARLANASRVDYEPKFQDRVEGQLHPEMENIFLKAVPVKIEGAPERRDPLNIFAYNPIPQGGLLSAYNKATKEYSQSKEA